MSMSDHNSTSEFRPGNGDGRREPLQSVSEAAANLRDQVTDAVSDIAREKKDGAAEGMHRAADATREAARKMEGDQAWMAGLVDRVAEALDDLSDSLRRSDFRSMLDRTEHFAREQPILFAGAAFGIGLLLARATRAGMHRPAAEAYGEY